MYDELKQILGKGKRMVFFGGAGVSTESGIPDFRSESGLYNVQNRYGVPPEYLLSEECFRRDPEMFFSYYKENLVAKNARPNKAHLALAMLEEQGKLAAVISSSRSRRITRSARGSWEKRTACRPRGGSCWGWGLPLPASSPASSCPTCTTDCG